MDPSTNGRACGFVLVLYPSGSLLGDTPSTLAGDLEGGASKVGERKVKRRSGGLQTQEKGASDSSKAHLGQIILFKVAFFKTSYFCVTSHLFVYIFNFWIKLYDLGENITLVWESGNEDLDCRSFGIINPQR